MRSSNTNKNVILKGSASFTDCIMQINNTQVDYPQKAVASIYLYNLIEKSDGF